MGDTIFDLVDGIGSIAGEGPVLFAPNRLPLDGNRLAEAVGHLARALRRAGVGPGDVVASMLPNGPEAATVFLASTFAGIAAPLNPGYRVSELEFYLSDLRPRLMIVPADGSPDAEEACRRAGVPVAQLTRGAEAGTATLIAPESPVEAPVAPEPNDVALILHTSGTTSRPKMVPLSHANLVASAGNVAATLRLTPDDRCLNVMPLFHIHGLVAAVLASLYVGAAIVATPGFVATEFFHWLDRFQPTWYTAVPTIHQTVLDRASEADEVIARTPLRFVRSSSASLAPRVMARLQDTFGVPVVEAYGMTEAAHQIACNPLPPGTRKPGTVGPPAGPEVAILTDGGVASNPGVEGEVVVRGPNVTSGYLASEEVNVAAFVDGWFRTGDLGSLDEDGYLRLTGRSKEMINRGGETIAPREIDDLLLDHPGVRQALAFAVPDRRLGEQVAAVVVPESGADLDELSLRRWMEERLSTAKVPRRILFMDSIPRGPTGKLQRIGLAERLGLSDLDDLDDPESPTPTATRPLTPIEEFLASLWAEVLDLPEVGTDDRFLDLGGDSMLATRLLARVREALDLEVSMVEFFDRPTVAAQASLIEDLLLADD
jgi:acyl-CoA synthetase (AMP-forming)/AMP-acid ligase II/acyl carrier protein